MIKGKFKEKSPRRPNDFRTSRFFARMLSIFGWAFMVVWLVIGVRYGVPVGQELHAVLVKYVGDGVPLLLVNLFLIMWLLALVMFGFMFVVAGQGMRAVFEMANSSKQLVLLTEEDMMARRAERMDLAPSEPAANDLLQSGESSPDDVAEIVVSEPVQPDQQPID